MSALTRMRFFLFGPSPPTPVPDHIPEPDGPVIGSLRIVPVGPESFGVERLEVSDARSRHSYRSWERVYGASIGDTLEKCESFAMGELIAKAEEEERVALLNAQTRAHHAANPPRIITLEDLGLR